MTAQTFNYRVWKAPIIAGGKPFWQGEVRDLQGHLIATDSGLYAATKKSMIRLLRKKAKRILNPKPYSPEHIGTFTIRIMP